MPRITGVDQQKCTGCRKCVQECGFFRINRETKKAEYYDPMGLCFWCGHCIAVCPENAVGHEEFGDAPCEFSAMPDQDRSIPFKNLANTFHALRSIRRYKPEPVPRDMMEKVLDAIRYAPSGANAREFKVAIVSNQQQLHELGEGVMNTIMENPVAKATYGLIFEFLKKAYKNPIYFDAPHLVICYTNADNGIEDVDAGIAVTYGRLAAEALGLGTCWNGWTMIAFKMNPDLARLVKAKGKHWGIFTIGQPAVAFARTVPRPALAVKWLE
ncbi:MAG: nitroreductase family protein [Candidatus Lokiarchaeota archaeon]|nr:nitroreductase family protein [Candidatus Lokiarchaeota archaeon]